MSASNKNFENIEELGQCMKASMLLPGVTGDTIRLKGSQIDDDKEMERTWFREWHNDTRGMGTFMLGSEPLVDSQLFQPIPYRAALDEGCTHVITFRTVADGKLVKFSSPYHYHFSLIGIISFLIHVDREISRKKARSSRAANNASLFHEEVENA